MKKRMLIGIAAMLFSFSSLMAQEVPAGVMEAFNQGNSQELGRYMGDKVGLSLPDGSVDADKQTATVTMQRFFTENKVSGFTVNHQGNRGESAFVVGTLVTANGEFRVNCFLRKTEGNCLIYQIRIDYVNK